MSKNKKKNSNNNNSNSNSNNNKENVNVSASKNEKNDNKNDNGNCKANVNEKHCHGCGMVSERVKRCGQCQSVFYCSQDCQRAAWKGHKDSCNQMGRFIADLQRTAVRRENFVEQQDTYEDLFLSWGTPEMQQILHLAWVRNDPSMWVDYVRNPKNPMRARTAAADMFMGVFPEHDEYREEMYQFALDAGHPVACLGYALECIKKGNLKGYELYLTKAAKENNREAKERLKEFHANKPIIV